MKKLISTALSIGWLIFILMIFVGSFLILKVESEVDNCQIKNIQDALWWSINVSSAVGDCELYPITLMGRIISVVMMIFGYALFSLNISAIVVLFHDKINKKK